MCVTVFAFFTYLLKASRMLAAGFTGYGRFPPRVYLNYFTRSPSSNMAAWHVRANGQCTHRHHSAYSSNKGLVASHTSDILARMAVAKLRLEAAAIGAVIWLAQCVVHASRNDPLPVRAEGVVGSIKASDALDTDRPHHDRI